MLENLVKAADIARSVATESARNAPLHIALFIAATVFSFTPACLISPEAASFRWVGGLLSVFSGSLIVLHLWFGHRPVRKLKWYCRNLATDEREVLRAYLEEDAVCRYYHSLHGPTCVLVGKGILSFASSLFEMQEAPVMIQPVARAYLRKRPGLVGTSKAALGSRKPRGRLTTKKQIPDENR